MPPSCPAHDAVAAGLPAILAGTAIGNVTAALARGPLDAVDTRILLCHALGLSRIELITQSERQLTTDEAARINGLLLRRLAGEPVAYLVGMREFFGLRMQVTRDVLIPRPETELLVELALARLPLSGTGAQVLDLGTGSGAIAVAIAHARPDISVTAVDLSAAALAIAGANAIRHVKGKPVTLLQGDWYSALDTHCSAPDVAQRFHLIVSNPPYIRKGDPHLSAGDLRFEPSGALTDGSDGLSAFRTIVHGAPSRLERGGWLLMEHGYDQSDDVRRLLLDNGFLDVQSWRDLAGIERVSGGRYSC